jgi:CRISPR-associated protein Cas2
MIVIIAYDVRDDDRRARLAATLGRHGVRLQKSVFECLVDETVLAELTLDAEALLDLDHDVLHVFRQCSPCVEARGAMGQVNTVMHKRFWVV